MPENKPASSVSVRQLYVEVRKLNEKLDNLADIRKRDHDAVMEALNHLKIEDMRIDNKYAIITGNAKAFVGGIAASFTLLGSALGLAASYIFGSK